MAREDFHVREAPVAPRVIEVSLTRERRRGLWGDPQVLETLARRRFDRKDLVAITTYAGMLEEAARCAREGRLGAFVTTGTTEGGGVRVRLFERVIEGLELRTRLLADRTFDAGDGAALVSSAEFVEQLPGWAREQNRARADAAMADLADDDVRFAGELDRLEHAADRDRAARELEAILRRAG